LRYLLGVSRAPLAEPAEKNKDNKSHLWSGYAEKGGSRDEGGDHDNYAKVV